MTTTEELQKVREDAKKAILDAQSKLKELEPLLGNSWSFMQKYGHWISLALISIMTAGIIYIYGFYIPKIEAQAKAEIELYAGDLQKRIDALDEKIEANKKASAVVQGNAKKTAAGTAVYVDYSKADEAFTKAMQKAGGK